MSQALRNVIPLVNLLNELIPKLNLPCIKPILRCAVHEDNQSTIAVAKAPSMLPRTKHIGLKHHHFRQHVTQGLIDVKHVNTSEQLGYIFTKPLPAPAFVYLCHKLLGW